MKYIVITGASRGVGYATTQAFVQRGDCKIITVARSKAALLKLQKVCMEMNGQSQIIPVVADIAIESGIETLIHAVETHFPRVDVLINNAGLMINKAFEQLTGNDFDRLMAVHAKAPFLIIQQLMPFLKTAGHVVNITSMGGVQGSAKFPGLSLYSASKGALTVLTECLAEELAGHGVRINGLAFGAVQTEMLQAAFPAYKAPVSAEQMGQYVAGFALEGGTYFNGKVLPVSVSTP